MNDYYEHYPKRTQLLDAEGCIKPDKWYMEFDNIKLYGVDSPVFESFYMKKKDDGSLEVKSQSTKIKLTSLSLSNSTFSEKINTLEVSYLHLELRNFFWQSMSKINHENPNMVADGIFIYSLDRVVYTDPFISTIYLLRWALKCTEKDIRILRAEKINHILYDKEI